MTHDDVKTMLLGRQEASDTRVQADRLMQARGVMVRALDDLNAILGPVCDGSRPNVSRAARPVEAKVGDALACEAASMVATLEAELGEDFAPADRAAWIQAYMVLAGTM